MQLLRLLGADEPCVYKLRFRTPNGWPNKSSSILFFIILKKHRAEPHQVTLPETNIFAPENGWLEYDCFLLGWPFFRGYVSLREGIFHEVSFGDILR